jgi:hypothetical protein
MARDHDLLGGGQLQVPREVILYLGQSHSTGLG